MAKREPQSWLARDSVDGATGRGSYVFFFFRRDRIVQGSDGLWLCGDSRRTIGPISSSVFEVVYPDLVIPPGTIIELEQPRRKDK